MPVAICSGSVALKTFYDLRTKTTRFKQQEVSAFIVGAEDEGFLSDIYPVGCSVSPTSKVTDSLFCEANPKQIPGPQPNPIHLIQQEVGDAHLVPQHLLFVPDYL